MILIAATAENGVIGAGRGMPWQVPEEYEHFRRCIRGNTVLIGRRSYEIFGPDLTSAHTIVLTGRRQALPDAIACPNLPSALDAAAAYGKPIFSCGGRQVYEQTLPLACELYLSTIKPAVGTRPYRGDTYFPEFDRSQWQVVAERDEPRYVFRHWVRREKLN